MNPDDSLMQLKRNAESPHKTFLHYFWYPLSHQLSERMLITGFLSGYYTQAWLKKNSMLENNINTNETFFVYNITLSVEECVGKISYYFIE